MSDAINPDHYKRLPAEAIEIIESAIDNAPSNQDAYLHGQVLKYILRCWNKNGIEDLKKAKWYLDRLVNSLDEYETQKASDLQSIKDHPFGKLKEPAIKQSLTTEPDPGEGYRLLSKDTTEDLQPGDGWWHHSEQRWRDVFPTVTTVPCPNTWYRRKVQPLQKKTEPPDGWRFLEVGEVIRKGDQRLTYHGGSIDCLTSIGEKFNHEAHYPTIRRNRFEVGEKVKRVADGIVFQVKFTLDNNFYGLETEGGLLDRLSGKDLAPYIEETK